jgi:hypothetical protein
MDARVTPQPTNQQATHQPTKPKPKSLNPVTNQVGRTNTERRYWADKKREQKLALIPLLQADEDLGWIGWVLSFSFFLSLCRGAELGGVEDGWTAGCVGRLIISGLSA